jgi:hypothetical protein
MRVNPDPDSKECECPLYSFHDISGNNANTVGFEFTETCTCGAESGDNALDYLRMIYDEERDEFRCECIIDALIYNADIGRCECPNEYSAKSGECVCEEPRSDINGICSCSGDLEYDEATGSCDCPEGKTPNSAGSCEWTPLENCKEGE